MAGVLTTVLNDFDTAMGAGFTNLAPTAHWLLASLIVLDLTIWGLWYALGGESNGLSQFLRKILIASGLIGLVGAWPWFTTTLVNGFMWAGGKAAGSTTILVTHPSRIIDYGWNAAGPIIYAMSRNHWYDIGQILLFEVAICITLLAFFVMAIQCFIAYIEFTLISVLTLFFIPFAAWKHTRFLGEKAFGALISHGIKLMVLAFIVAIAGPVFVKLVPLQIPTLQEAFATAVGALAIMILAIQAPTLAAGLLGGAPSLGAGAVAGAAMGVGAGAALAATGVGAAGTLAKAGTGAAAKAAGALHEGAMGGLKDMTTGGGATLSEKAAGLAVGAGSVAAGAAARKVASPADYLRQKFNEGRLATFNRSAANNGGPSPAAPPGGPAPAGSGSTPTSTSTGGAAGSTPPSSAATQTAAGANKNAPAAPLHKTPTAQAAQQAAQHVADGDASGGGIQPSIKDGEE